MITICLPVEGMSCGGCENSVQNALLKLDGVDTVKADHIKKIVNIDFKNDNPDIDLARDTIEKTGFKVLS